MASVAGLKSVSSFSNEVQKVTVVYDFSVDGGAVGSKNLMTALEDMVILQAYAKVKTACTSGGSATLTVGTLIGSTAVASLTAGAVIKGDSTAVAQKLADGASVAMAIGTAAFTAGVIHFEFLCAKF